MTVNANGTTTLTYFTEDNEMVEVDVVEVELADIRNTDEIITSIEANGGWWTLYKSEDDVIIAVFEEDEE